VLKVLKVLENQSHSESKQEDEYNKQEDISTKEFTDKDITSSSNYSRYQYTKEDLEKFFPLNLNNIGYPIILISSNL
jgi:hypothetical protein